MRRLFLFLLLLVSSSYAQTKAEVSTQVKGILPIANGGLNNSAAPSTDGQLPIWSAANSRYEPGDPIVSFNYVNIWTTQDITVTRTSAAVRVPTFSSYGTLYLTFAGITGSPATCTLQIKSTDSVGNLVNNGSTVSIAPANGTTSQAFTSSATAFGQAKIIVTLNCGTFPTAGTLTLDFVPMIPSVLAPGSTTTVTQGTGSNLHVVTDSGTITTVSTVTAVTVITNALPAGSNLLGKFSTDQTTHGTSDLVAADITKINGSAVSTAATGIMKVGLAGNAGGSMETSAGVLDTNLKNIGNSAVSTAATGIQKVGIVGGAAGANVDGAAAGTLPANVIMAGTIENNLPGRFLQCDKSVQIVAAAVATTAIVAASGSTTIYVCAYGIQGTGAAGTVRLVYGTGSTCGTGTTNITPAWATVLAASGNPAFISQSAPIGYLFKTIASQALCATMATTSATANIFVSYGQF